MSQIQTFSGGGGGGTITSVSATSDSTNQAAGIYATTVANAATVILSNRLQGTATSTAAGNADIITFALAGVAASYRFRFDVVGRETTTGDTVGYTLFASYKTDGAAATIVQNEFIDADEDAALTASTIALVPSTNSVILRANGVAGTVINYSAVGSYVQV